MLTNPSTLGLFDEHIEEIARDLPRRRRAPLLRRREPQRRLRDLAARRHGLRHRPHQPAQDVLAAARRRRAGRRADRRARHARAVPAGAAVVRDGERLPARPRPAEVDRQGARLHRAVRRVRPLVRVTSARTGRGCARCPRRQCSTRTTCSRGSGMRTTCRSTGSACTSSCSQRALAEARARHHGARRREAVDGLRLPSADDLLPARRPGGADDRADGDRGEGDARRVRRRDARDRARGCERSRRDQGGAARSARCSVSTRCEPRSARS